MADWNMNPSWVAITDIVAQQVTKDVGVTDDMFNKVVENLQFLYNNIGGANVAVGTVSTTVVDSASLADVTVTDRKDPVRDWTYLDFVFKIPQGPTGKTPNLQIGDVVTGLQAAATITGTPEEPILNLTLPKGDKGDAGNPVWIRYATDIQGSGITNTPTEATKYIGFYIGATASANPADYTWSKYVGKQPSTIVIEGTSFNITWDDGSTTQVPIDVSQCVTATPIDGIVTSVNGMDGAVVIPNYVHTVTINLGTTSSNYYQLISVVTNNNTPINTLAQIGSLISGIQRNAANILPLNLYTLNVSASGLTFTPTEGYLIFNYDDSGVCNQCFYITSKSFNMEDYAKEITNADISDKITLLN